MHKDAKLKSGAILHPIFIFLPSLLQIIDVAAAKGRSPFSQD